MDNIPNVDDFNIKTKHINTLFQFIKKNKEDQFLEYISNLSKDDVDINMKDENGNYLIFFAIMINNHRILQKILEYGARLDILDTEGYSILYYPIKFNYFEIIDTLLDFDKKNVGIPLINLRDSRGAVPIFYALKYKNRNVLQELLSNGADANYKTNENMNSLHLAVLKKDIMMVKMLIKYIKTLDTRTREGSTALHYACNFQLVDIVRLLLENGANQNIIEFEYDFYPIFYAVVQNNVEITKLLVDYKANPNNQDYLGNTIIHYAIINNHAEILDYIFNHYEIKSKKNDVYVEDINSKNTLNKNIDPNIVNIEGLTIGHLFLYNYDDNYKQYLIKLLPHSNLNYQDNISNTMLHIIMEKNLLKIFEPIIKNKKMNIYIKNKNNDSVLDMVPLREKDLFLDIVTKSYYKYLKKYDAGWLLNWQNECSGQNISKIDKTACYKNIKNAIVNEKMSIPVKKDKKIITIQNDKLLQFTTFTGSLLDTIVGFKYLIKKYPYAITMFHSQQENTQELDKYNKSLGIQENPHQHLIHFEIRWLYQKIFFPVDFEKILASIINGNKYKFIIIPIGIILSNGNHSNGLFYDIENHILERFEPHGSNYPNQFNYNPDLLDEILHKKITNMLSTIYNKNIKLKYYQPKNYLPKIGFQTYDNAEINVNKNIGDPNGFCTLWTIWYLDYRLQYFFKKPQKVVNKLIHQIRINNYSFRTIIRNYSKAITDLRDSYLSKINRNINDYLNNKLSPTELKKLLIEILTDSDT